MTCFGVLNQCPLAWLRVSSSCTHAKGIGLGLRWFECKLDKRFLTRLSGKLVVLKVQATTISSRRLKGLYLSSEQIAVSILLTVFVPKGGDTYPTR